MHYLMHQIILSYPSLLKSCMNNLFVIVNSITNIKRSSFVDSKFCNLRVVIFAKWTAQPKIKKTLDMWHRLSHLTSNFLTKVAKIFGKLLGYFEKVTCLVKTVMATFGQSLENFGLHFIQIATQMAFTVVIIAHWTLTPANTNWALFYSNILSHWLAC